MVRKRRNALRPSFVGTGNAALAGPSKCVLTVVISGRGLTLSKPVRRLVWNPAWQCGLILSLGVIVNSLPFRPLGRSPT